MTKPISLKAMREGLGLNQTDFWSSIDVTQSGGSRYEAGRQVPKPIQKLLVIAYGSRKESNAAVAALRRESR